MYVYRKSSPSYGNPPIWTVGYHNPDGTWEGVMRETNMDAEREVNAFAVQAAKHFGQHPENYTYTEGGIKAGSLFAMRYGLPGDSVVVFRIDSYFEPVNYQELIIEYIPKNARENKEGTP